LRASWAKTVTCPATGVSGTYPKQIKLTNLCVIGCGVTHNTHTTYTDYTPSGKKQNILAQLDTINYDCKNQRYTSTGADEYTHKCMMGEPAALNECKEVDMDAPSLNSHQGSLKITFSKARHPTTDPSRYGIGLYLYNDGLDGVLLQSQYTSMKEAVFDGLSVATTYYITYNMTYMGGVYINSNTKHNFTTSHLADRLRKKEHHDTSLDVPQTYFDAE